MNASRLPTDVEWKDGTAVRSGRWSRRRWGYALAGSLVVQLALLFHLGERPKSSPPCPGFGTSIHLAADAWATEQLGQLPMLCDPTLFALPGTQGFSGNAWLRFATLQHQPLEWTDPPRWLEVDAEELGACFSSLVLSHSAAPLRVADKPLPRLIGADAPVAGVPLRRRSELRLEGDLARWRMSEAIELPAWSATDLLSNSVVQVLVDAEGRVFTTTLLAGSGLPEADQQALRLATGARFDPMPAGPAPVLTAVAQGRLVFQWQTLPSPGDSAPASPP